MPSGVEDYKSVQIALATKGGLTTIINKLRKIAIGSEDLKLRQLIAPILSNLDDALKNNPSVKAIGLNLHDARFKPVLDYCAQCIASAKPQWQILAERYGWLPPSDRQP